MPLNGGYENDKDRKHEEGACQGGRKKRTWKVEGQADINYWAVKKIVRLEKRLEN